MRLKQLELYGYKSFASRTVFAFGEGLTAIVGPNGSGKSNITDALRWVLGEQSNRTLRAGSSEEMIFSGGPRRPRLGMAEVLLTLDNASGWLPIAYTEVAIGRRAYRSGDSEYLLNGQRVRYRDLVELLEQGGLGGRGQVIIGQGMVDAVLSLSPDARRALFEEAAGIAPHLRKRAEALRRIEETERNLERVGDILAELRPRAGRLRRQADRAEEQRLLAQDLYQLQRIWYGYQWQRRYREVARAREELAQATLQLDQQRAHVQGLDAQRTALDAQRAEGTRALERQRQAEGAIRDRSEALRRELAVLAERVRLYAQQEGALDAEIASLASRADILQGEVSRTRQALGEQEQSRAEAQAELEGVRAQMADADRAAGRLRQEVAAAQKRLAEITGALADAQARLAQGAKQRALWSAEEDEAQAALAQLAGREAGLRGEGEALDERTRALQGEERRLAEGRAALERESAAAQERLHEAEAAVGRARSDRERLVRRRDALAQVRQEMAAYAPGVRAVLAEGDKLPGILGTVAALMTAPRELERAIEAALGSRLQNLVTERWADAERAIAHLKETRSGWATFLPLDTVRSGAALRPPASPGVVGVASELVQYDARLRPAYQLLLGRVLVVRDLPTARRLLDERTGASLLVTLEGDAVQASGAVTGGAQARRGNLLAQEREWRELPGQLQAVEEALSAAVEAQRAAQAERQRLAREASALEGAFTRWRQERERSREASARHAEALRALEREREWQAARLARLRESLASAQAEEERLQRKVEESHAAERERLAELAAFGERLQALEGDGVRQRASELEMRLAIAQRAIASQGELAASHERNLAQLHEQLEAKRAQRASLGEELAAMRATLEDARSRLEALSQEAASVRQAAQPLQEELRRLDREEEALERQRAEGVRRLRELEQAHNGVSLALDRAQDGQTALTREIEESLGPVDLAESVSHQLRLSLDDRVVELPQVASLPPGLGDDIRELKARLRRIGNVNAEAPQEYEQLMERQTFLESQAADLRGAIASLREVIAQLDALIKEDFGATIRRVDTAFGECFRTLFGGGSAHLALLDPQDMSTSGVDIIAQPPGKKAQNLSLLSGGERALTGVALLFALLRANPVPFCVLDEVDAALDEANVGRFRDLLREQARETQFVVITHNRTTVEAAETIYGISMGEQGVSECLSLRLPATPQADAAGTGQPLATPNVSG